MNVSSLHVPGVAPLSEAEGQFLEVMLTKFRLTRDASGGLALSVNFDDTTPAVRKRRIREDIRDGMPDFKARAKAYQASLDAFCSGEGDSTFKSTDEHFPFRFCSGGAIPVVSMGGKDYYCFNWRDIEPVGWNLANGGSETRAELLYPVRIIGRELREEMLVFWPNPNRSTAIRGELSLDNGIDHPDAELAWGLWTGMLGHQFQWDGREVVPVVPLSVGRDELEITFSDKPPLVFKDIAININALDNGIEVDRLIKIALPENATICDGEILSGHLLNSIKGLFEVNRLNEALRNGSTSFLPDRFFFGGRSLEGSAAFDKAREQFIDYKRRHGLLTPRDEQDHQSAVDARLEFDLCPATRTALRRCLRALVEQHPEPKSPVGPSEVFLSFASEDAANAERVANFLEQNGFKPFFSAKYRGGTDFGTAIDDALESARCFVAVTSKIDHLAKAWLKYESGIFKILRNRGDKPGGLFFTVAVGIDPNQLPPPYCAGTAIPCTGDTSMEESLQEIIEFLQRPKNLVNGGGR